MAKAAQSITMTKSRFRESYAPFCHSLRQCRGFEASPNAGALSNEKLLLLAVQFRSLIILTNG